MNATQQLHDLGQSLWLDNITRGILNDGTLERYIRELAVTGPTSGISRPGWTRGLVPSPRCSSADVAVKNTVQARLVNRLGIAVAQRMRLTQRVTPTNPAS